MSSVGLTDICLPSKLVMRCDDMSTGLNALVPRFAMVTIWNYMKRDLLTSRAATAATPRSVPATDALPQLPGARLPRVPRGPPLWTYSGARKSRRVRPKGSEC